MQAASDVAVALKAILAIGAAGVRKALHGVKIDQRGVGKGKPVFSPVALIFVWVKLYLHKLLYYKNHPSASLLFRYRQDMAALNPSRNALHWECASLIRGCAA